VYFWTFRAINKRSKRYSGINNLNTVLSFLLSDEEYENGEESGRFEDTSGWDLEEEESNRFTETIKSILHDKESLLYLEDKLDEDRNYGEWENVEL
jgi:hypothetical protein